MSKAKTFVWGGVLALALAGSMTHFSVEDAADNTPPNKICEDFPGFRTNDKPTTFTISKGDTVSEKVTAPLANQLDIEVATAEAMVKKANPGVYDLGKVDIGAIINVPNCAVEQGNG